MGGYGRLWTLHIELQNRRSRVRILPPLPLFRYKSGPERTLRFLSESDLLTSATRSLLFYAVANAVVVAVEEIIVARG